MASAVKKAMIYTLIAAAALPLYYVLFPISRLLGVLMLLVFAWQLPLVLGSWFLVISKHKRGKRGLPERDRFTVMVWSAVITTALSIALLGVYFVVLAVFYFIELLLLKWFATQKYKEEQR